MKSCPSEDFPQRTSYCSSNELPLKLNELPLKFTLHAASFLGHVIPPLPYHPPLLPHYWYKKCLARPVTSSMRAHDAPVGTPLPAGAQHLGARCIWTAAATALTQHPLPRLLPHQLRCLLPVLPAGGLGWAATAEAGHASQDVGGAWRCEQAM